MFSGLVSRNSMTTLFRYLITRESSSKLFVGGLSYDTNEPVLKNEFEKYGEVIDVRVICDHKSGKSKGYGFVLFDSEEAAAKCLSFHEQSVTRRQKHPSRICSA